MTKIKNCYKLVLSGFIADQIILQSNCIRNTPCHNQSKSGSLWCYVHLMTFWMQKTLYSLDSIHRYDE